MDAESQLLADKDAEIERLKGELEASRRLCQVWIDKSTGQDTLIIELADALVRVNYNWPNDYDADLLQRAREATK